MFCVFGSYYFILFFYINYCYRIFFVFLFILLLFFSPLLFSTKQNRFFVYVVNLHKTNYDHYTIYVVFARHHHHHYYYFYLYNNYIRLYPTLVI